MAAAAQKEDSTNAKIDDLGRKLDMLMERLAPTRDGILGAPPNLQAGGPSSNRDTSNNRVPTGRQSQVSSFHHKIEFPYFEEGDPKAWLRKCERYF